MNRRVAALVAVCLGVGIPGAVLRLACAGNACNPGKPATDLPFCSLPPGVRSGLSDGFYEGRSPDIMVVTGSSRVRGGDAWRRGAGPVWPALSTVDDRVPLVFAGAGVSPGELDASATLDQIAPSVARALALERPHPDVRSGAALGGIDLTPRPRVVVLVVWHGVDAQSLGTRDSAPWLHELLAGGTGTLEASIGSLPADPAAVSATIGTGGLPRQHGITSSVVRNAEGGAVRAWSKDAPLSVIATLGDDLDERFRGRALIGLVGTLKEDRGLIGGNWYLDVDRDDISVHPKAPAVAARAVTLIRQRGYGRDDVPDLLAVTLKGEVGKLDDASRRIVAAARDLAGDRLLVVATATGGVGVDSARPAQEIVAAVEEALGAGIIDAAVPGGFYLNQREVARRELAQDEILKALRELEGDDGKPLFAQVFPDLAVTFGRYC